MKKILMMTCLALVFALCVTMLACGGGDASAITVEETVSVELTKTYRLLPKLNGETLKDATYASANETIATVSSSGLITGNTCGETTVTVSYEQETADVKVTVALGETVPVLKLTEIPSNEFNVYVGDEVNLSAKIGFGTKDYEDATITYTVSDPTKGSMAGSTFTALAAGACDVVVSASWRNVSTTLKETVKINVIESAGVEVLSNVNVLYDTSDGALEESDLITMFGSASAQVSSATVEVVNTGDEAISIEVGANNALTFKKDGVAIQNGLEDGSTYTVVLGSGNKQVEVKITPCTRVIRTATDLDVFEEASYSGATGKRSYGGYYALAGNIDASSYTAKVKDFGTFDLRARSSGEYHDLGFKGVFDGRGYTIDGLTVGEGGLFGVIHGNSTSGAIGGTVKNVGFTNAKINVAANGDKAGVLAGAIYQHAVIENVYIEVADFGTKGTRGGLAFAVNENAYLRNVLIVEKDSANNGKSYTTTDGTANNTTAQDGATIFVYRTAAQSSSNLTDGGKINTNDWVNVFTVSDMYDLGGKFSGNRSILNTLNSSTKNFNDNDLCNRLLPNLYSFASFAAIKTAYDANANASVTVGNTTETWNIQTNVNTFSTDYWAYDSATGTLSWKTAQA